MVFFVLSGLLVVGITSGPLCSKAGLAGHFGELDCLCSPLGTTSGIAQSGPQLVADRYSYLFSVWSGRS